MDSDKHLKLLQYFSFWNQMKEKSSILVPVNVFQ